MFQPKKVHFIAIGGSVMHNLAIALHKQGHRVSGSDDEIEDPSRSRLSAEGLIPSEMGWFPDKLDKTLDAVILGMHAQKTNPELLKAQELGIPIYSFPDYIYEHAKDKQRIVIGGSHGKTTITALVIHVLNQYKRKFDYVVGAQVEGIDNPVKLSDAPIILIEGDEYLASAIDPTPKLLKYQHHMGVLSGIAWDHANVFPTRDEYIKQFERFADSTPKGGTLIYNSEDQVSDTIGKIERADVQSIPYKTHDHVITNGVVSLVVSKDEKVPIQIFGKHNLQNISAARELLKKIGISSEQFYKAVGSFKGAAGRLQKIYENNSSVVYKDFAHAPSKVKATVDALKNLYTNRKLVGCLELHTFSSLNKKFLPEYKDSMKACDTAILFYNPDKVKHKNLEPFSEEDLKKAFNNDRALIFTDKSALENYLTTETWNNKNLLLMSSGNFNGMDLTQLTKNLSA